MSWPVAGRCGPCEWNYSSIAWRLHGRGLEVACRLRHSEQHLHCRPHILALSHDMSCGHKCFVTTLQDVIGAHNGIRCIVLYILVGIVPLLQGSCFYIHFEADFNFVAKSKENTCISQLTSLALSMNVLCIYRITLQHIIMHAWAYQFTGLCRVVSPHRYSNKTQTMF